MKFKLIFSFFLIGCSNIHPDNISNLEQGAFDSISLANSKTEQIDSIIFNTVRINDSIPLLLPEAELLNKLGKPDSIIVEYGWDCGNYLDDSDSVGVYYYGLSRFIVSKGKALLHKFVPDNRMTLCTNSFKITGETNESELKLLFTKSYTHMLERIKNDKNFGERRLKVGMSNNPVSPDDNGFIFYFENGKIIRIELWWFIC